MNKGTAIVGFILSFLAGMLLVWGIDRGSSTATATRDKAGPGAAVDGKGANPGAVSVELYVMSQCPYGVQAEDAFKPVIDKFGADIDFKIEFIGQEKDGQLTSMHGPKEVKGNLVQICAMKHAPAKYFDMILCQNKNMREVDTNWEACASTLGINTEAIRTCADGEEGKGLLATSFKKAQEKGARGSPTIMIGGKKHEGGRRANDLMKAICNAYSGAKPAACSDIPESPKVNVTFLTDKRCADCDTKRMEGQVRQKVANPVVTTLDYGTPEGKKMFDAVKPTNLPVAIFDATLDADKEAAGGLARGLKPAGDYKVMGGGAWNPACADDGGCNLEECKPTLQCRPEEPKKLEVFVMSECPFGVKGLDAMKEVLDNFKKSDEKIDFKINFIGDGGPDKLTAMHGQSEVDENIREICAITNYPDNFKYMDYIWCRNKNIKDKNWQACTGGDTGIDTAVIEKCFNGEGKELLAKSYAYSKAAGFAASPTWLANGKYKFSGVDPETIKTNVCKYNKLGGCDNKLSGPAAPAKPGAAAPGCGG
jgi:predicted DsbA family dithiol-disulfide isomerase